jgi:hypothetical protein
MDRPWVSRVPGYAGLLGLMASLLVLVPHAAGRPVLHLSDADCAGGWVLSLAGQPDVCAHPDSAPAGVDVHAAVSSATLKARRGAGATAFAAAQDLGVPGTYATNASSSAVTCDGDGVSGARVQAMYVVEAGRTNRYLDLLPSLQLWAAGTDDVLNRSAALTGGSRSIRYVTDSVNGSCVARVLNVTVPAGAMASFGTTISAVQALGYTSAARKYLMWTDATSLCGIATMYPDETAAQSNLNNGSYAQYARVDSGCWGFGNGTTGHSVEAHELTHTLGAVQYQAPHSTRAGHCWDESDTMCYADGGNHSMVQVCPGEKEYLLDCNSDDYFSTYPTGYLASAWNSASSRFLIGGGNGTNGGTLGAATSLGGTIAVNNPAIPGLATQASVTPDLPSGRTLASVSWRSAATACSVVPTGDGTQASVTCPVTQLTATTVTAVLTDSTGATKTLTSPLTMQTTGTKRNVTVGVTVDGQSPTADVCTGVGSAGRATVRDAATGAPVKGITATFTRQSTGALTASTAGSRVTGVDGVAAGTLATTVATAFGATTPAVGMFNAGSASTVAATPARCTVSLSAVPSATTRWYGETVTVTGSVTRGDDIPVVGASVPVTVTTSAGRVLTLATATTSTGTFTTSFRATTSGRLGAAVTGTVGLAPTTADLGDLTVNVPTTALTAAIDRTDVGYGTTVTATGSLTKTASTTGPVPSASVSVKVTAPGRSPVVVASGVTKADGTFTIPFAAKLSGEVSVVYAGAAGMPAASDVADSVTVGTWTPAVTLASSASSVVLGGSVTLTGEVHRSYGGTTELARSVRVQLVLTPSNGTAPVLLTAVSSTSTGTYRATAYPRVSGTITAVITGVVGYSNATSTGVAVTIA